MKTSCRLERLERLESWLKSDNTLVLSDAARVLNVSLRTVHRDLDVLRERGVPIESDRGRGGGVRVANGWGVGKISLTRFELLDMLVGFAVADALKGHLQMAHADTIRSKLLASFSVQDQRRIKKMRQRIRVGELAKSSLLASLISPKNQVGDELKEAFALNRIMDLNYTDQKGVLTKRLFEPHFLVLNPPIWYVVGWDYLRSDIRTLRSDRISDAKVTGDTFVSRPWNDFASVMDGNPTKEV